MHLHGVALQWHLNYMRSRFQIYPDWPQYINDINFRFGAKHNRVNVWEIETPESLSTFPSLTSSLKLPLQSGFLQSVPSQANALNLHFQAKIDSHLSSETIIDKPKLEPNVLNDHMFEIPPIECTIDKLTTPQGLASQLAFLNLNQNPLPI